MSKKNQKKEGKNALKIVAGILAAVIVLGVIGVYSFLNSGYMEKNTVAAKTEHYTISSAMLTYLYNTNYQNLLSSAGSYLQAMGLDTNKPLENQKYAGDDTWHDYMLDSTRSQLTNALVLSEAAIANGFTLTDEDKADIDETISTMATYAKTYGVTLKQYIKSIYGNSVTEKDVRYCLEILMLAENYQKHLVDTYEYTADDWAKYYKENEKDFLKVDYLTYTFKAEKKKEETKKDSETTTAAQTKAADTTADTTKKDDEKKEPDAELGYAEALAKVDSADAFKAYVKDYLTNIKYKDMTKEELEEDDIDIDELVDGCLKEAQSVSGTGDLNKWLADDARHAYEVYTDFDEEDGEYKVYMILPAKNEGDLDYACKYRETYLLKDYRYIPVSISSTEKDKTKAMENAKKEAEDILKKYTDDATDANFAKLADEYGDGYYEGGLIEAAPKGTMNEDVSDWVYAEDRKAGDTKIIEVKDQGYYIVYFKGNNTTSWEHDADTALKSDKYEEDYTAYSELYKVTYYKKGVGLVSSR